MNMDKKFLTRRKIAGLILLTVAAYLLFRALSPFIGFWANSPVIIFPTSIINISTSFMLLNLSIAFIISTRQRIARYAVIPFIIACIFLMVGIRVEGVFQYDYYTSRLKLAGYKPCPNSEVWKPEPHRRRQIYRMPYRSWWHNNPQDCPLTN